MSSLTAALRIKLTEVLYVPWLWHWFSFLRSQADTSRSAHLGYPKQTFPAGGKFVHTLLVKHPPEDQIIHLELSASHEPLVVVPERLPVACIFNRRLPSSPVNQVDILTPELVLRGFIVCLDTQRAHGDFGGKDGLSPIHHGDPSVALGSSAGPESWDPDLSAAPGSSSSPGSWDPVPSAEELPSSCRPCGPDRLMTSTMLTASEVAAM
jgi:hypothetical protein